jgi:hypothetical protein
MMSRGLGVGLTTPTWKTLLSEASEEGQGTRRAVEPGDDDEIHDEIRRMNQ